MTNNKQDYWQEDIHVNRIQYAYLMLQAKNKYAVMSRGTGKSFIVGAEVDENVRIMPRGITTIAQATIGQALTKTLPSTFKMLEMLGYKPYDYDTHTGDYVVCKRPPESFIRPYEHLMQFDHVISFSNGHCLYILTQEGNSRGPNADFNITDEALTINKEKFDQEVAPTNRGNECIFGKRSEHPIVKHHGNAFLSSMPYTAQQKWLLAPAEYYEKERGIPLFQKWNRMVSVQMQLIEAYIAHDRQLFRDLWNEAVRMRHELTPFVSKDSTLFILGSVFDNIENLGMSYIVNQYRVMDKLSFMVEILNFVLDKVDHCYYKLDDRHLYYNAINDSYLRDFAENHDYNWQDLAKANDSRADIDCDPTQPLEISTDWGSAASFLSVGQERRFDFASKLLSQTPIDCVINEFFVRRDDETDTEVNALADKFIAYYEHHACKRLTVTAMAMLAVQTPRSRTTNCSSSAFRSLAGLLSNVSILAWNRHSMRSSCCGPTSCQRPTLAFPMCASTRLAAVIRSSLCRTRALLRTRMVGLLKTRALSASSLSYPKKPLTSATA